MMTESKEELKTATPIEMPKDPTEDPNEENKEEEEVKAEVSETKSAEVEKLELRNQSNGK